MPRHLIAALFAAVVLPFLPGHPAAPAAQLRPQPVGEHPGRIALGLALRKLGNVATLMQTTAHPDDEDNALLAMASHGLGMRAVLVSATRGEGGQNEIGPELFDALGVLRTEELHAVHRFDGAEQYFTRAIDFGFSFSVEESIARWGRDEIVGDYVRHIRAVRPEVIVGFLCGGAGGGQHHQASTRLTAEAVRAAADPAKYPEQLREGLRPWRVARLFCTEPGTLSSSSARQPPAAGDLLTVDTSAFDALLGRTYAELGLEARSMHKCQGMTQLLLLPGRSQNRTYRLMSASAGEAAGVAPEALFAGIDTTLAALARFAPDAGEPLRAHLAEIAGHVEAARAALEEHGPPSAIAPLAHGLRSVRSLRTRLGAMNVAPDGAFEIDFRVEQKERQFQDALVLAAGMRLEALADDGLVVPGGRVAVFAYAGQQSDVRVAVRGITLAGSPASATGCTGAIPRGRALECRGEILVDAAAPYTAPYWRARIDAARYDFPAGAPFGLPFAPTPYTATFDLRIADVDLRVERPIEFRYSDILAGEKRMELHVVPPLAAVVTPDIAVVPSGSIAPRRIDVRLTNHATGAASAIVGLRLPARWRADPEWADVSFRRTDEEVTVAFSVVPPPGVRPGDHLVSAVVRAAGAGAGEGMGYRTIEYPHTRRRHLLEPAQTRLKVVDVTVAPGLDVGYVMGVGDQVPQALEQLGAAVTLIGPEELASGDLSKYDAIVTGVRAYERRADLRAHNHRLLAYVEAGGTALVQYNKFEFNEAQYGPYPAKVSGNRVTDETAPVELLAPAHPVFTYPNRIGEAAWTGWVQERGLYFLGEKDPRYADLVRLSDPFPFNPGAKTGALVEAKVGKGRWIYIGLGLWRQLPAGVDGAYQLMANLLSLGARR